MLLDGHVVAIDRVASIAILDDLLHLCRWRQRRRLVVAIRLAVQD
jgi:hypothetical protein